jgi:hypothetical protein
VQTRYRESVLGWCTTISQRGKASRMTT